MANKTAPASKPAARAKSIGSNTAKPTATASRKPAATARASKTTPAAASTAKPRATRAELRERAAAAGGNTGAKTKNVPRAGTGTIAPGGARSGKGTAMGLRKGA
jgi:hypothetical protein